MCVLELKFDTKKKKIFFELILLILETNEMLCISNRIVEKHNVALAELMDIFRFVNRQNKYDIDFKTQSYKLWKFSINSKLILEKLKDFKWKTVNFGILGKLFVKRTAF